MHGEPLSVMELPLPPPPSSEPHCSEIPLTEQNSCEILKPFTDELSDEKDEPTDSSQISEPSRKEQDPSEEKKDSKPFYFFFSSVSSILDHFVDWFRN